MRKTYTHGVWLKDPTWREGPVWLGDGVKSAVIAAGPSGLGIIWSGDHHGEFEWRTIPADSRARNSAWLILSLSGSRQQALAKTGRLEVSKKWRTPWRGLSIADKTGKRSQKRATHCPNTGPQFTPYTTYSKDALLDSE